VNISTLLYATNLQLSNGNPSFFGFARLYESIYYVMIFAVVNAAVMMIFCYNRVVHRFITWIIYLQIILGLAPIVLILRGIERGNEANAFVYGMPVFHLLLVLFLVIYQIRMLSILKKQDNANKAVQLSP